MRTLLLSLGLLFATGMYGQSCRCDQDTLLKESISCKPTIFDNKAKLFWSFNCDSSWLTFQSSKKKQKLIFSLGGGLVSLTTRLGYMYWTEFNKTFLITNHVISGCCDPVDYYLYDKTSGNLVKYLGRSLYTSENRDIPFVVSITKSNYDHFAISNYNSLTVYNLDTHKEYRINIPKGDIERGMKNNDFMFPEFLFETPEIIKGILILKYVTKKPTNGKPLHYKKIIIDLKKYSR